MKKAVLFLAAIIVVVVVIFSFVSKPIREFKSPFQQVGAPGK